MSSAAEQSFSCDVLLRSNKSYSPAAIATATTTTSKSLAAASAVASEATPLIRDSQRDSENSGGGGGGGGTNSGGGGGGYSTRHGGVGTKLNSDVLANVSQCMATNLTTNILGVLLPSLNTMVGNVGVTDLRHHPTTQGGAAAADAQSSSSAEKQSEVQPLLGAEPPPTSDTDRILELEDSVIAWQDKYNRLYESHKRVQKVNQSLEDKLLKLVDRNTGERVQLTSDVATLSVRLAQANFNIAKLQHEIDRYKSDINLAIQLLQCKPDNFVPQKVSSLPIDIQSKVSCYMRLESNSHSDSEGSPTGLDSARSEAKSPKLETQPFAAAAPRTKEYLMGGIDAAGMRTANLNNNNISDFNLDADNANNNHTNNNKNLHHNNNNNINNINNGNQNHVNNTRPNQKNNNNPTNDGAKTHSMLNNPATPTTTTSKAVKSPPAHGRLPDPDLISPITMAKFLKDELKAAELKHCETCQCSKQDLTVLADVSRSYTVATQTVLCPANAAMTLTQLCLRCHSSLSPPAQACSTEAFLMELVKPGGGPPPPLNKAAAAKKENAMGKLMLSLPPPPTPRDDIMLHPILGHHRMCERTLSPGDSGAEDSGAKGASLAAAATAAAHCLTKSQPGGYGSYDGQGGRSAGGCQRRFLDGGGTALDLLEKFEQKAGGGGSHFFSGASKKAYMPLSLVADEFTDDKDDAADETKPLLLPEAGAEADKDNNTDRSGEVSAAETHQESTVSGPTERGSNLMIATNPVNSPGSVTSVWSRTSSCEGVKMFENFNRNLIKTIKAENPKNLGPRLCAMRIQQNGQSNILLDSLESFEAAAPPVVYKRRERLLDEELGEDGNVVISSQTAPKASPVDLLSFCSTFHGDGAPPEQPKAPANNCDDLEQPNGSSWLTVDSGDEVAGNGDGAPSSGDGLAEDDAEPDMEDVEDDDEEDDVEDDDDEDEVDEDDVEDEVEEDDDEEVDCIMAIDSELGSESPLVASQPARGKAHGDESAAEEANSSTGPLFEAKTSRFQGGRKLADFEQYLCFEQQASHHPTDGVAQETTTVRYLKPHAEVSDMIDDVVDLQETAILRRQQLSRVAEWVQSNTQQLEQAEEEGEPPLPVAAVKGKEAPAFDKGAGGERSKALFTTSLEQLEDFVSVENPSSLDSGYKTTPQPPAAGGAHLVDEAAKSSGGDSLSPKTDATNTSAVESHSGQLATVPSVHTQYRRITRSGLSVAYTTTTTITGGGASASSFSQPTCDILNYKYYPSNADKSRSVQAELHTSTRNVDIAQMEYNVKQFLLKQDEWSMRAGGGRRPSVCLNAGQAVLPAAARSLKLRRSKLFGPGVGERVVVPAAVVGGQRSDTGELDSDLTAARSLAAAKLPTVPQRTETNL